jgi:ankyrin repeat protein
MHGHIEVSKLLLHESSVEEANEEDNCGTTPLMEAARFGFLSLIELLIQFAQANLKEVNKQGLNCLHIAAEAGETESVRVLVEKYGMDVNSKAEPLGMTALHWAAKVVWT